MKSSLRIIVATALIFTATATFAKGPVYNAKDLIGTWECGDSGELDGVNSEIVTSFAFDSLGCYCRSTNCKLQGSTGGEDICYNMSMSVQGKYKIVAKRLVLMPNPLSFNINADDDSHIPGIIKIAARAIQEMTRIEMIGNIKYPKILSLTENEFSILEVTEDEDGDPGEFITTVYNRVQE